MGGYKFNRVAGIEVDYLDYGESDVTSITGQANISYTFHNGLRPFALLGLSFINLKQEKHLIYKDNTHFGGRWGSWPRVRT